MFPVEGLDHRALFYRDQREYLACVGGFVRAGLARGQPAIIAVPGARASLLRRWLGPPDGRLAYLDMAETGRNPARIIPALRTFVDDQGGGQARVVSEPAWPGRSAAELRETIRHEALINLAFAGAPVSILCPYAAGLAGPVIEDAGHTHPTIVRDGQPTASPDYAGRGSVPPDCGAALPAPPTRAETVSYRTGLRALRQLVTHYARRCGLSADRTASLELAVGELAANTLRHTSAGGTLHVWHTRGELLCQIEDQGWITDPLAGRRRRPAIEPGHGLWVVNQVCDLVEMRTGQAGTTIRLHMNLACPEPRTCV
jgi:anti-sigma regulatory factor (Ser/Thr protein kinase)